MLDHHSKDLMSADEHLALLRRRIEECTDRLEKVRTNGGTSELNELLLSTYLRSLQRTQEDREKIARGGG
jgi:hypothetical protein